MNSLYLEDHSSAYSFPAQRRDALWSSSTTSSRQYDSQHLVYNLGPFDDESSNEVAIKLEQSYYDSESSYSESISYQIPYGCAPSDIHSCNYPIKPDPDAAYPLPLINMESNEFAINVEFDSPLYDLTPPSPSEEEKSRFESRSDPDSDVSHEFSTSIETQKNQGDEVKPIEAYPRRKIVPRTRDSLRDFTSSLERQNRFPSQAKRPDKRDKLYKSAVGYRLKYLWEQLDARREINCIAHVVAQLKQDFPQRADEFKSDMVTKPFEEKPSQNTPVGLSSRKESIVCLPAPPKPGRREHRKLMPRSWSCTSLILFLRSWRNCACRVLPSFALSKTPPREMHLISNCKFCAFLASEFF
jgi:hypothetical protein